MGPSRRGVKPVFRLYQSICMSTMPPPEPGADMRRRDFLGALGGTVTWSLAAHAQQSEKVRRIGVLVKIRRCCGDSMLADPL
jgi:hypothetical protein